MAIIRRRYRKILESENPRTVEGANYVDPTNRDVALSIPSPGEITIRESQNKTSDAENEAIIEDERRIWEVNRKLQISKVKALIETEISEKGVPVSDEQRKEIYKSVGMEYLLDENPKYPKVTTEQYFSKEGYDKQKFDLSSELGNDMISPSDREFEKKQLEELMKYTDYSRLPFKIKILFPTVSFDTDIETALYTIGLKEAEIISTEKAQEKTGNEDLIEQTKQETQIKLFLAKALSEVLSEIQMEQNQKEMEMGQKFGFAPQGFKQKPQEKEGEGGKPNPKGNQLDLKNRTNVATRLAKRGGIGNATRT
jgi:hypothetical protein